MIRKANHEDLSDAATTVQWNLDRLDQHFNSLDGKYNPSGDGSGIDMYILDAGIRYDHTDFSGRVRYAGMDSIDELTGTELNGKDCNGHGTHCATIAGGKTHGVTKGANVVYRTSILYRTRMVHTIRVYAYGMTVRVWYGYLYHMSIATILLLLFTSSTSI